MIVTAKKTRLGVLTVEDSGYSDEEYPGFSISLRKDGKELGCVLVEVDQTKDPMIKIHIWDTESEEPILNLKGNITSNVLKFNL